MVTNRWGVVMVTAWKLCLNFFFVVPFPLHHGLLPSPLLRLAQSVFSSLSLFRPTYEESLEITYLYYIKLKCFFIKYSVILD